MAPSIAVCALSTPASASQPSILSAAWFVFAEMSPELALTPPKIRQKINAPIATSPSRTRMAPPTRGTLWCSNQPTAGPATAPSTAAKMTGMTMVDVWPSSQMTPTMISRKPTSSHEEKPRSRNHVGAENCALRSVDIRPPVALVSLRPAIMRPGGQRGRITPLA